MTIRTDLADVEIRALVRKTRRPVWRDPNFAAQTNHFISVSLHCFFFPASILGLRCPGSHSSQTPPAISWHLLAPLNPQGHPMRQGPVLPSCGSHEKTKTRLWNFPKACKWKHRALLTPVTRLPSLRFFIIGSWEKAQVQEMVHLNLNLLSLLDFENTLNSVSRVFIYEIGSQGDGFSVN